MLPHASRTPPSTPVFTATATPDQGYDAVIHCRGGIYGEHTVLGLRQVSNWDGEHETAPAVAVEIASTKGNPDRGEIVAAVAQIVDRSFIDVQLTVPAFVQVPEPQKVILFLSPGVSDQGSIHILREVKELFERQHRAENPLLREGVPSHVPFHGLRMPGIENPVTSDTEHPVFEAAAYFKSTLLDHMTFPNWRDSNWSKLESVVAAALLTQERKDSATIAFAQFVAEINKHSASSFPMKPEQRDQVLIAYIAASESFAAKRAPAFT